MDFYELLISLPKPDEGFLKDFKNQTFDFIAEKELYCDPKGIFYTAIK